MDVVYERCCGLDVHQKTVVACLRRGRQAETRTFRTVTDDLIALVEWLAAADCEQTAMESTGSYWKPIYNLLEAADLPVIVVNPAHMKALKGRKTDRKDAAWIAELLQHGLLQPSFIPDRPQRELRELVGYRRSLVAERAREINRIQKVLEGANIKLKGTIADVVGCAGRAMLEAIIAGETDPAVIAGTVTTHVRATKDELRQAVHGRVTTHQRWLLREQLLHLDHLTERIAAATAQIEERMRPFEDAIARLDTIPGINRLGAQEIIAWIGTDMSRFPDAAHLASWAKLSPGNNQSGGKCRPGRIGKVTMPLRATLVEAAHGASITRNCYLADQCRRITARRGKARAMVAVAHSILEIVYHLLKDGGTYEELGEHYLARRNREANRRRLVRRLEALGYRVTVEEVPDAA
jgi:transposase